MKRKQPGQGRLLLKFIVPAAAAAARCVHCAMSSKGKTMARPARHWGVRAARLGSPQTPPGCPGSSHPSCPALEPDPRRGWGTSPRAGEPGDRTDGCLPHSQRGTSPYEASPVGEEVEGGRRVPLPSTWPGSGTSHSTHVKSKSAL